MANPDTTPGKGTLTRKVARLFFRLQSEKRLQQMAESSARNPSVRDPARDRDATSLGVIHPRINAGGAALAGAGGALGGAALFTRISRKVPLKIGPIGFLGGGGIALRMRW